MTKHPATLLSMAMTWPRPSATLNPIELISHRGVHVPWRVAAEQLTGRLAAQPAKGEARQLAGVEG